MGAQLIVKSVLEVYREWRLGEIGIDDVGGGASNGAAVARVVRFGKAPGDREYGR